MGLRFGGLQAKGKYLAIKAPSALSVNTSPLGRTYLRPKRTGMLL